MARICRPWRDYFVPLHSIKYVTHISYLSLLTITYFIVHFLKSMVICHDAKKLQCFLYVYQFLWLRLIIAVLLHLFLWGQVPIYFLNLGLRKAPTISDRCFSHFYLYLYDFIKSSGVIAGTSEFSKSLTLQVIM